MKYFLPKSFAILLALVGLLAIGCKKHKLVAPDNAGQQNGINLTALQKLYNQKNARQTLSNSWLSSIKPNWDKAVRYQNEKETVYEVEIENPDRVFIAAATVDAKKADEFERKSSMKLVFLEKKGNQRLSVFVMVLVAGPDTEITDISKLPLHYKAFGNFSGIVNYYEVDGSFTNGWVYQNGKIIAKLSPKYTDKALTKQNEDIGVMNAPVEPCGTYRQLHWRRECVGVEGYQNCNWASYYTTEVLYCPVNDGGGGDSGNGGYQAPNDDEEEDTENPEPNPADSTKIPCRQANLLAQNAKFKQLMAQLKTYVSDTTDKKEYLYAFSFNSSGKPTGMTSLTGTANQPMVSVNVPAPVDAIIHSHYAGNLYSIFSFADLQVLATFRYINFIKNPKTFTLGLVTAKGTQYLLKIDDLAKFDAFANRLTINKESTHDLNTLWQKRYNMNVNNSIADNELNFIKFLEGENSGLKLFKGNNTFTEWNAKKIQNGAVVDDPCLTAPIIDIE